MDMACTMYNDSGVLIQVITVEPESTNTFNSTSVLTATTSALDMLNVNSITCGQDIRSPAIDLTMLNVQGSYDICYFLC